MEQPHYQLDGSEFWARDRSVVEKENVLIAKSPAELTQADLLQIDYYAIRLGCIMDISTHCEDSGLRPFRGGDEQDRRSRLLAAGSGAPNPLTRNQADEERSRNDYYEAAFEILARFEVNWPNDSRLQLIRSFYEQRCEGPPPQLTELSNSMLNTVKSIMALFIVVPRNQIPEDEQTCYICLTNIDQSNECIVALPCNHRFGDKCIITWIVERRTCPSCRREYGEELDTLTQQTDEIGMLSQILSRASPR